MDSRLQPTLKRKILNLLSDGQWHSMFEMVRFCNEATSISQRIGDMIRAGIEFDRRHFGSRHWQWRLITPVDQIDFERASLKSPACDGGGVYRNRREMPNPSDNENGGVGANPTHLQAGKNSKCEPAPVKAVRLSKLPVPVYLNKETGDRPVPLSHSGDLAGSQVSLPPERPVPLITQDSKPTLPAPPLLQMEIAL